MTDFNALAADIFAFVNREANWSSYRAMVRNVFQAFPTMALTQDQIETIARTVYGLPADASLSDALAFLVKSKALRTRKSQGKRFYEINF
jgi:hypothetical protein